ncbi:hypothetical protein [Salinicoccus halodurans]|uniref:DUF4352 domain-containing protein n=1 Tax=Salinicoccus halodurans TaxID=407035 RepID=A0AA94HDC4_9STAP|nr:hypothetical protein [Salinicoccus halodurans]SFK61659.1 hypothetical protein SAMN05216235_0850 [Salinicoccus halodurans]
MKKYLLTGGFAAMLLLAACGNEEPETAEESTEEETTEESTEEETSESAEASESTEEETTESTSKDTTEKVAEEAQKEGVETIKAVEPGETTQIENVNVTVNKAQINRVEVTEELATFLDGYEAGEKVDNLVIEYTVENTTEAPRDFYIDQAVMVTSTGQQIDPEMFLAEGITGSMLGAIEYTGSVPYLMEEGAGDEIEWVEVNIPAMMDGESYERVSDETKLRIEF